MLRLVEPAVRPERQPERIAVAAREDVAADAVDRRVVGGDRAVELDAQDLALVAATSPSARDLGGGRQVLRAVGIAAVRAEVAPLIADVRYSLRSGPNASRPPTWSSAVGRPVRMSSGSTSVRVPASYRYRRTASRRASAVPGASS